MGSGFLRRPVLLRGRHPQEGIIVGYAYITQTCDVRLLNGRVKKGIAMADVSFREQQNEQVGLSGRVQESTGNGTGEGTDPTQGIEKDTA